MTAAVEPRLLLLETSGRSGWVAVAEGGRLRGWRRLEQGRRNARDLTPAAAELLAEAGWKARDLHGVVIGRGPGSYTGLRVGLMAAKALAYATGCALLTLDTFSVLAEQAPPEWPLLDVLADAQQDRVYVQAFVRDGAAWRAANALAVRPFDAWLAGRRPDAGVTGPGLVKWAGRLPPETPLPDPERREPAAEAVLRLGLARFRAGERDDVFAAEPLYLRPSSAEEQWEARKQG